MSGGPERASLVTLVFVTALVAYVSCTATGLLAGQFAAVAVMIFSALIWFALSIIDDGDDAVERT